MARPGFLRHKKFARLARLLGSKPLALGSIEMIWEVAYENGDPDLGSAEDVEFAAEWAGESGKLVSALTEAGLLDSVTDDDGRIRYEVHDLHDHAPEYVTGRREKEKERRKVKVCAGCGGEFHSSDKRAKHCSAACRQRAHRDRETDGDGCVTEIPSHETDRNTPPAPAPAPAPAQQQQAAASEPPAPPPGNSAAPPAAAPAWPLLEQFRAEFAERMAITNLEAIRLSRPEIAQQTREALEAELRRRGVGPVLDAVVSRAQREKSGRRVWWLSHLLTWIQDLPEGGTSPPRRKATAPAAPAEYFGDKTRRVTWDSQGRPVSEG